MISYDLDRDLCALQPVLPVLEGFNYGEGLFVRYPVVPFCRVHGPQVEGDGVVLSVSSPPLAEDGAVCIVGGIGFHAVPDVRVWVREYRGRGNYVFEGLEGFLFLLSPPPRVVVLGEVMEGSGNVCEVLYETAVEVTEPDELSDSSDFGGWLPFLYHSALIFVHAKPIT